MIRFSLIVYICCRQNIVVHARKLTYNECSASGTAFTA